MSAVVFLNVLAALIVVCLLFATLRFGTQKLAVTRPAADQGRARVPAPKR